MDLFEHLNKNYIRKWLEREPEQAYADKLFAIQRHLQHHKGAVSDAEGGGGGVVSGGETDGEGGKIALEKALAKQQLPDYDGGTLIKIESNF